MVAYSLPCILCQFFLCVDPGVQLGMYCIAYPFDPAFLVSLIIANTRNFISSKALWQLS